LPAVERMLIFDLGMHLGLDTQFYLKKGFRVIAVEAAPLMIENARTSLSRYIETGQLVIVDRAFWSVDEEEIPFYINREKDDWSVTASVFEPGRGPAGPGSERPAERIGVPLLSRE